MSEGIDKQALIQKVAVSWNNQEEKAYLIALLEADGATLSSGTEYSVK